jgi:ribonuclease HI
VVAAAVVGNVNVIIHNSNQHTVGLCRVPGHAGVQGNHIANKLARGGSVQKCAGPEPFLGGL